MTQESIPFRIRLGVTGHRELTSRSAIADRVRQVLAHHIFDLFDDPAGIRRRLEDPLNKTPVRFSILTPLAEGADRVVAEEVLATPDARLHVVLPMPIEEYEKSFTSADSLQEFEQLYASDSCPLVLNNSILEDPLYAESPELARQHAYLAVGEYVVDNSDVVLAVWDEKAARGVGGTGDIVTIAKEHGCPVIIIPASGVDGIKVEKGDGLHLSSWQGLDAFNRFSFPADEQNSYNDKVFKKWFDEEMVQSMSTPLKQGIQTHLIPAYTRASHLAKISQYQYNHTGHAIFILSPLVVLALALGVQFPWLAPYAYGFEFFILLAIILLLQFAERKKVHQRWIEVRALAERIRAALFLIACQVRPKAMVAPPFQRIAIRSDDWIIRVYEEIIGRVGCVSAPRSDRYDIFWRFIQSKWLEDQIHFHLRKSARSGLRGRRLERWGALVFGAGMLIAGWHLFRTLASHTAVPALPEQLAAVLAFFLPAAGAALGSLRTHGEYSRLAKRSQAMSVALSDILNRSRRHPEPASFEPLLREIESLMIEESQDWMVLMKQIKLAAG